MEVCILSSKSAAATCAYVLFDMPLICERRLSFDLRLDVVGNVAFILDLQE